MLLVHEFVFKTRKRANENKRNWLDIEAMLIKQVTRVYGDASSNLHAEDIEAMLIEQVAPVYNDASLNVDAEECKLWKIITIQSTLECYISLKHKFTISC